MEGEVIKEFLVGLGFSVDSAGLAKFNDSIKGATLKVAAMAGAVELAATGIFWSIAKISEGFEDMGYQLRLVAPAINKMLILRQAMISAYAAAGINLTKAVQQSILFNYSLAKTKYALEAVWKSVGLKFLPFLTKQMDIFRQKIFANMPKIQAQLEKVIGLIFKAFGVVVQWGSRAWDILGHVYDSFKKLDEATGGWSTKVLGFIAVWRLLNLSFIATPLGAVITGIIALIALYDDFKVWEEGGRSLIDWSGKLGHLLLENAASAKAVAEGFADFFKECVYWFNLLIEILSTLIFKFLQTGITVEGALSRFGDAIIDKFSSVKDWLSGFFNWAEARVKAFSYAIIHPLDALSEFFGSHSGFAQGAVSTFGAGGAPGISGQGAQGIPGSPGDPGTNALSSFLQPQPLVNTNNNGGNRSFQQETNINVQGGADASAIGKSVAGEQDKTNLDLARYFATGSR